MVHIYTIEGLVYTIDSTNLHFWRYKFTPLKVQIYTIDGTNLHKKYIIL